MGVVGGSFTHGIWNAPCLFLSMSRGVVPFSGKLIVVDRQRPDFDNTSHHCVKLPCMFISTNHGFRSGSHLPVGVKRHEVLLRVGGISLIQSAAKQRGERNGRWRRRGGGTTTSLDVVVGLGWRDCGRGTSMAGTGWCGSGGGSTMTSHHVISVTHFSEGSGFLV